MFPFVTGASLSTREGHCFLHVGVIEIRTLPHQSVRKLIKINFVASPKTEISQIDLLLLTQ